MTKKLLRNEKERWEYVWSYVRFKFYGDVWHAEDIFKLKPFFDFSISQRGRSRTMSMTTEESESFDYYMKCRKEYADADFVQKRSVDNIEEDTLLEAFGYELAENDEEYVTPSLDNPPESLLDLTFPVVCVSWIESDSDRHGPASVLFVEYVSLADFEDGVIET